MLYFFTVKLDLSEYPVRANVDRLLLVVVAFLGPDDDDDVVVVGAGLLRHQTLPVAPVPREEGALRAVLLVLEELAFLDTAVAPALPLAFAGALLLHGQDLVASGVLVVLAKARASWKFGSLELLSSGNTYSLFGQQYNM